MSRAEADGPSPLTDRDELAELLRIHQEIARISRTFLSLEWSAVDEAIRHELGNAAALAGADRTVFIWTHPDADMPHWVCEWSARGARSGGSLRDTERYEWSARELLAGRVIHLPRLDALPAEAAAERSYLTERGVRSLLTFPVHSAGERSAYQSYERSGSEAGWSDEHIGALRLLGEIFASTLKRRHTEAALRESEERFRTIAEEATELVAEFDSKGRYCYVSPSYEVQLGYRPEDLLGDSAMKLIHPDDNPGSRMKFERSFKEAVPSHSIHRLRHREGGWRWFENSGRAYEGPDKRPRFVSIGIDITERVEAQQALERQLELERTVARLSRRLLGLRDEELGEEILKSLADTGRRIAADRAFLANFPDAAGDRGRFQEWHSERTSRWTRAPTDWGRDALARGVLLHYPDLDDLPAEAVGLKEHLRGRGVTSVLSIPVRTAETVTGVIGFESCDQRVWSEDEIRLLRLIGEILVSAQNRQKSERALRESQLQLAQAQKLEAVGRLAGGIAHDFNNLLTVILGLSRPILRSLEEGSELHEDMVDIHGAAERATALTRQLLMFSRRQPIQERVVDLNAILTDLRPLLSRMLGEDVLLELDLPGDGVFVRGDPHQFEQVVVNLAANARDAMPGGGTLRIGTEVREPDADRVARLRLPGLGAYVVVSVSDSGEGMDERTQRQIFDPFYTTKDPGKGTGLGLSIVYSVVEQATGAIEVESVRGEGTRFLLWLPAVPAPGREQAAPPDPAAMRGDERVLFVEDEPAVRRLGMRILEQAGYRVFEAHDGQEAITLMEQQTTPVDVVVSDVIMPNMGGAELARRLRATRPDLPILFVSGHPEDRAGAVAIDGAELLRKPFTAEALLQRLRELLDRHQG